MGKSIGKFRNGNHIIDACYDETGLYYVSSYSPNFFNHNSILNHCKHFPNIISFKNWIFSMKREYKLNVLLVDKG